MIYSSALSINVFTILLYFPDSVTTSGAINHLSLLSATFTDSKYGQAKRQRTYSFGIEWENQCCFIECEGKTM